MLKKITIAVFLLAVGFIAGYYYLFSHLNSQKKAAELADALPDTFYTGYDCVVATKEQQKIFQRAVSALGDGKDGVDTFWVTQGIIKFLGTKHYGSKNGENFPVCPPEDIYIAAANNIGDAIEIGGLQETQLNFASKFSHPNTHIINAVADTAFSDHLRESETDENKDIRPYARTVLAGFKKATTAYSDIAFKQISSGDSLGTGAAQIAVAEGHPEALEKVELLMRKLLSETAADTPIPWDTRNRLYELSYAIYLGGEAGKKYSGPIEELMARKVESWAPPFGMVELSPKRMCKLLEMIKDTKLSPTRYNYCVDDNFPYEQ